MQVLDEAGVERAHVVGTSLGGMVAQELALAHPSVSSGSSSRVRRPVGRRRTRCRRRPSTLIAEAPRSSRLVALRRFVENALSPQTVAERPGVVEWILAHRLATAQPPAAWAAQAAAGATFDRFDRLAEIRAATLVQTGTEDVVVDPRNSELLAEHLPSARLERFAGAGHLFFWEQPDAFVESVTRFLEDRGV